MQAKQLSVEQCVDRFFSDQGITQPLRHEIYWRKLASRFGETAKEFGDRISRRQAGENVEPYSLKNSSLEFSDAVTSQADSPRLRKFFSWFLKQGYDLDGKTLLDFGCDSGLFACFVAQTFPTAKVAGFDPCAESISVANQRAAKSGLNNVQFFTGKPSDLPKLSAWPSFDFITSMLVFHELLADGHIASKGSRMTEGISDFSLTSVSHPILKSNDCPGLFQIAQMLAVDGRYISLDRWGSASQLLRWVRFCENAGLNVLLSESFMLSFKEPKSETNTMPISVFSKNSDRTLAARADDILALFCYPSFLNLRDLYPVENAEVAELIFESLSKEHLYIEEAVYKDGSGVMRTYVGTASGIGYLFKTTNQGFRQLHLLPAIALHEHLDELKTQRLQAEKIAHVTYEIFNEPLQRSLKLNF